MKTRINQLLRGEFEYETPELLFSQDKVFVNHKAVQSTSHTLKDGDTVSVRGYGKFEMHEILRSTKKDRLVVEIALYL